MSCNDLRGVGEGQPPAISVSIVEDGAGVREGLVRLLKRSPGFRCQACYSDGETALQEIPRARPDLVLMDINLPGMSGIECVQRLHALEPSLRIVMLTVYENSEQIFSALCAGAIGYLLKQKPTAELLEAIRDAHQGHSPMSSQIARRVAQFFRSSPGGGTGALSSREEETLKMLAKGFLVKEIAQHLDINFAAVRGCTQRIYEKLHARSRAQTTDQHLQTRRSQQLAGQL